MVKSVTNVIDKFSSQSPACSDGLFRVNVVSILAQSLHFFISLVPRLFVKNRLGTRLLLHGICGPFLCYRV